jgi:catechol 2,3-dioxygenase-like lactoylglutathione lyase family enzyme
MGTLQGIGHVGLFVADLDRSKRFFCDLIGLTITDQVDGGPIFLSSRPNEEHHELVLVVGRNMPEGAKLLQQLSFRCTSLDAVIDYYKKLKIARVRLQQVVSHGNAVGVYFFDPDGNRCEVYWDTGLTARQPFVDALDLDLPAAQILEQIKSSVARYGATGFHNKASLAAQQRRWIDEGLAL